MKNIFRVSDFSGCELSPHKWTLLIPAGGLGTRLGSTLPKPLQPVLGVSMLDRVLKLGQQCVQDTVVVVSPALQRSWIAPGSCSVVVQEQANGMADAIDLGLQKVCTENVLIIWADQVLLNPASVLAVQAAFAAEPGRLLSMGTVLRENPYIEIIRNEQGQLLAIKEQREGLVLSRHAESDSGLFAFHVETLRKILLASQMEKKGAHTGEFNLLPLLPKFEIHNGAVASVRLDAVYESLGINTPADLQQAENILRRQEAKG